MKIEELISQIKEAGYASDTKFVLHDVEQNQECSMYLHSEKIAIAYGLISIPV